MARWDSVTVSMAADVMGMLMEMVRVNLVVVSASDGRTPLRAGTRETSSKVRASGIPVASILYLNKRALSRAIQLVIFMRDWMPANNLTSFEGYPSEYGIARRREISNSNFGFRISKFSVSALYQHRNADAYIQFGRDDDVFRFASGLFFLTRAATLKMLKDI